MRKTAIGLVLALSILGVGCASKRAKNVEDSWVQNFTANIENAGRNVTRDTRTLEGHHVLQEEEAQCSYAKRTRAELVEMRDKAEEVTALDVLASTSNNYWALLPIPGASILALMTKDQDELGLFNRNGCWSIGCVEDKIAISDKAVVKYCGAAVANTPGPNALPSVSAGSPEIDTAEESERNADGSESGSPR